MTLVQRTNQQIIRDLGDGLILRRATRADTEALVEFNTIVQAESPDEREERVGAWTRDLMEKPHPTFQVSDFTLVEDIRQNKIVSSLNLIPQTWSYAGIPFGVGRPEVVGTLPEYRNRGLVRAQFEVIHRWSQERGLIVQAITGIPYFYRQFGYEMALSLGGGRAGYQPHVPKLEEGKTEPYIIRRANQADLPFIARLYDSTRSRYLVNVVWNDSLWLYELNGKSEQNINRFELRVIETAQGEAVGFLAHPPMIWGERMIVYFYELLPGVSYGMVTPSVVRYLWETGKKLAEEEEKELQSFAFWLGREHPAYRVMHDHLPYVRQPYAWYLRVPDLPSFLRLIKPVLEARLAASPLSGHTGQYNLTFYRSGLHLESEKGKLKTIEAWQPEPQGDSGMAGFPGLTFLQLVFGYRSLDELQNVFPDCWSENDEVYALLTSLFPRQNSDLWPIA